MPASFRAHATARVQGPQCIRKLGQCARPLAFLTVLLFSLACTPNPREVEGAIARAVAAASAHDAKALFNALDQRERFAMAAVVKARKRAAEVIRTSYPPEAQAEALARLGDALHAETGAALLAMRCPTACMDALAARLSSPRNVQHRERTVEVETVRGERLELYRADDGTYGLVWNSEAAQRENSRAFAELDLIKQNADMYAKQRALK